MKPTLKVGLRFTELCWRWVIFTMTDNDNYIEDSDESQPREYRDKVPIPVRRSRDTDEDESATDSDKHGLIEIPRRWRNY